MKRDSRGTIRKLSSCIIVFLIFIVSFSILFVDTISSYNMDGPDFIVSFYYSPENPVSGEIVQFYDNSSSVDPISTWTWRFSDDNSYSFEQNPLHIFNNPGPYTVTLRIEDISGQTSSVSLLITVLPTLPSVSDHPIANFTYSPENPEVGEEILFTDTSEPGDGEIIGWNWDFGDGTLIAINQNPYHIYSDAGPYDVTLIVADSNGFESQPYTISITVSITVEEDDPPSPTVSASFTYEPTNPEIDEVVTFADTSESTGGEITGWNWDFGDGIVLQNVQNPTHQYSNSGDYTVELRVTLDDGTTSVTDDLYETIITVGGDDTVVDDDDDTVLPDDDVDDDPVLPDDSDDVDDDSENDAYYDPITTIVTSYFDNVTGQEGIDLDNSHITSVHRINFTLNNTYRNVTLSVEKLKEKPIEIPKDPLAKEISEKTIDNIKIYKYLNLSLTANNTYIEKVNMTIWFRVDKIWFNNNINIENNTNTTLIKLMRYHDGKWERLKTELVNEDDEYLYYEAVTPGLSTFAVVGGHVVEPEPKSEKQDTSPLTWELLIASIVLTMLILVIILVKHRYIYLKK